jgi:hypothetical protein
VPFPLAAGPSIAMTGDLGIVAVSNITP